MKKLLATLLIAALMLSLLTACGNASASSSQPAAPAAANSAPQPEPEPEPEPPYEPAVLTGLPKGEDYPEGQRITAVMVNNISNNAAHDVRPQNGLSDADILIEIKVEGGITRFCALFTDYNQIEYICPVRSARDQFFQLFLPFQPVFIHIGESVVQTQYKKDYTYESLDVNYDQVPGNFRYDSSRLSAGVAQWETAYLTQEDIQRGLESMNTDTRRTYNSPFFDFVNYNEPNRVLTGGDATGICILHSPNYRTFFDWDASAGKYMMSQYSMRHGGIQPSTDANNNEQLGFENVLVLFTEFDVYPDPGGSGYDLQKVSYTYGGVGCYFSGGRVETVRWQKGAPQQPLRILDGDGNETNVKINPGKTYIAVVDLEMANDFIYTKEGSAQNISTNVQTDESATDFVEVD